MKKKYKALMIDLDGTTIPNERSGMPSEKVIESIHKAQKKLAVCVVTGRFLYETAPILDTLSITTPTILLGGSQIIDGLTRKYIYEQPLANGDVKSVLSLISKYKVNLILREKYGSVVIGKNNSNIPEKAFSIFIKNLSERMADKLVEDISHIPTIAAHKILSWEKGEYCLDITHVTATKQHAIFEVAKLLKIETHEMIGIGEGPNDFPLLMACGLKVAMGNAVDALKEIADYIAPSVENDGVADVIDKFIL